LLPAALCCEVRGSIPEQALSCIWLHLAGLQKGADTLKQDKILSLANICGSFNNLYFLFLPTDKHRGRERERERVRKDSRRVGAKRKLMGKKRETLQFWREKEYPVVKIFRGKARLSF
jgi:hypothetical protein